MFSFAIRNDIATKFEECPVHILNRIATACLHLANDNLLNVISVFAFYKEVTQTLSKAHLREQTLLMGDLSAL